MTVPLLSDSLSHGTPIAGVLVAIVVIVLAARIGGSLFESLGQPSVLGELVVGVVLGNLTLAGISSLEFLRVDWPQDDTLHLANVEHCAGIVIDALARIGVLLLMFQVGLENSVTRMRRVGASACLVAMLGVVAPFLIGWGSAHLLLPDAGWPVHVFLAAALCATSVGITARVFEDLGITDSAESQIVLGAAVIDDVLALIVLSVVQVLITSTGSPDAAGSLGFLLLVTVKAGGFLLLAILFGPWLSRQLFHTASLLHGRGLLICTALAICFSFSWGSSYAGLAPLVGAFAAGLILESTQYRELAEHGEQPLHELLRPLADFITPIFFVMTGFRVDLSTFADLRILGLTAILSVVAIAGKLVCGLGARSNGVNRLAVGIGMIPRGEVGLIFAGIGLALTINGEPLLAAPTYSALVATVMVTTLAAPPLLTWSVNHPPK